MNIDNTAVVIGCGRAGFFYDLDPKRKEVYSHLGAYAQSNRCNRIVAVDTDAEVLPVVKKHFPGTITYDCVKTMFMSENVDIVSIATPTEGRLELIKNAISSGAKYIFCEKPLANSISEARKIIELCEVSGVRLAVNHYRRWDKFHRDVACFLKEKKLGDILSVSVKYNKGILNTGSHVFDLLRMFFGEIESFKPMHSLKVHDFKGDPSLSVIAKLKSGIHVDIIASDSRFYRIFEVDIIGTKGRMILDNGYSMRFFVPSASTRNSEFDVLHKAKPPFKRGRMFHYECAIENILESSCDSELFCSGEDGLKSLEASMAAGLSCSLNKEIVLPLDPSYHSYKIEDTSFEY